MSNNQFKIVFLNQVSGRLFQELARGLADSVGSCVLYTGNVKEQVSKQSPSLNIVEAPVYGRGSNIQRIIDWLKYFCFVFWRMLFVPESKLLFIVSNPPFLPIVGYLMKKLKGQKYVVLIYDIWPDAAICLGKLSENGIVAKLWRWINRLYLENAEAVFTIGTNMAQRLERMYNPRLTTLGYTAVIPNWVDCEFIKPIPKESNWFAQQHGQADKLTILYSGNLGAGHDLETVVEAAQKVYNRKNIQFIIIGEGYKFNDLQERILHSGLDNMQLLPLQPEATLPYSLTTGDIAIITLVKGAEGVAIPSKVYYALASGAALICICSGENELKTIVEEHECGIVVAPGDVEGLVKAITKFNEDTDFLKHCQNNARVAAERYYTKDVNLMKYRKMIGELDLM